MLRSSHKQTLMNATMLSHNTKITVGGMRVQRMFTKKTCASDCTSVCVCLTECCRPSFRSVVPGVFRQALSPAGFVTEWVQWSNALQSSSAAVNRSSRSAGQRAAQMHDTG